MRSYVWLVLILSIAGCEPAAVPAAGPGVGNDRALREACTNFEGSPPPDPIIQACTILIQGGQLSPRALAAGYFFRGNAFLQKGQSRLAFNDLDQSIKIDPANIPPKAWWGRARLAYTLGDTRQAISDMTYYIKTVPADASGYYLRGLYYRDIGDAKLSAADYAKAKQINEFVPPYPPK
jgi:tetratricopeptide (TPR) repeat protein